MAQEIERKYLVLDDAWRSAPAARYRQGYLCRDKARTVRVRTIEDDSGARAFLTIKGVLVGAARNEFEYEIPQDDARMMLDTLCDGPLIEKDRRKIEYGGLIWEVDEFLGDNAGLVFAEVELRQEDQTVALPPWIGAEVTHLPRYFNANLSIYPYCQWTEEEKRGIGAQA